MDEQEEERLPVVPLGEKKLRACLVTGLVKTEEQWLREGNDNVPCLELERDREKMFECTSADFDGMAAIMQPNASWVARWQGVASPNFVPGCYALGPGLLLTSTPSRSRITALPPSPGRQLRRLAIGRERGGGGAA